MLDAFVVDIAAVDVVECSPFGRPSIMAGNCDPGSGVERAGGVESVLVVSSIVVVVFDVVDDRTVFGCSVVAIV